MRDSEYKYLSNSVYEVDTKKVSRSWKEGDTLEGSYWLIPIISHLYLLDFFIFILYHFLNKLGSDIILKKIILKIKNNSCKFL